MAILSSYGRADREKYIGWAFTAGGVGLIVGPLFAALFYQIGGISAAFFISAGIYLCTLSTVSKYFIYADQIHPVSLRPDEDARSVPVMALLQYKRFLFGAAAQLNIMMTLMFIQPSISVYIKSHGYKTDQAALVMGLTAVSFGLASPFIYKLTAVVEKRGVILVGTVGLGVAVLMVCNTSLVPGFQKNALVLQLGLILIGGSASMMAIPSMAEMMATIEEDQSFSQQFERRELETVISSIYVVSQSVGEALGPLLNSILITSFGFQTAHEILAAYLLLWGAFYFLSCDNMAMFNRPKLPEHEFIAREESVLLIENQA